MCDTGGASVGTEAYRATTAATDPALPFWSVQPVECKVRVSQDLLQLPGCLDPAVIKGLEAAKILSASDLLALPRDRRAPALVAAGVSQGEAAGGATRVRCSVARGAPRCVLSTPPVRAPSLSLHPAEDASLALDMLEWLPRVVVDARLEPLNRAVGVVATYMTSCEIRVSIVRPRHFRQTAPVEAPAPGTRAAAAASPPEKASGVVGVGRWLVPVRAAVGGATTPLPSCPSDHGPDPTLAPGRP